jgi:hypothetical protein
MRTGHFLVRNGRDWMTFIQGDAIRPKHGTRPTSREDNMKIRSLMLLVVCAIALSGCETVNKTWHDIFGLNDTPTRTAAK